MYLRRQISGSNLGVMQLRVEIGDRHLRIFKFYLRGGVPLPSKSELLLQFVVLRRQLLPEARLFVEGAFDITTDALLCTEFFLQGGEPPIHPLQLKFKLAILILQWQ